MAEPSSRRSPSRLVCSSSSSSSQKSTCKRVLRKTYGSGFLPCVHATATNTVAGTAWHNQQAAALSMLRCALLHAAYPAHTAQHLAATAALPKQLRPCDELLALTGKGLSSLVAWKSSSSLPSPSLLPVLRCCPPLPRCLPPAAGGCVVCKHHAMGVMSAESGADCTLADVWHYCCPHKCPTGCMAQPKQTCVHAVCSAV
jgi:hypothetical protein